MKLPAAGLPDMARENVYLGMLTKAVKTNNRIWLKGTDMKIRHFWILSRLL